MKKIALMLFALMLLGCNDDSTSPEEKSVNNFVGVWEMTELDANSDLNSDEKAYVIITDDNQWISYFQDTEEEAEGCYVKSTAQLTELSDNVVERKMDQDDISGLPPEYLFSNTSKVKLTQTDNNSIVVTVQEERMLTSFMGFSYDETIKIIDENHVDFYISEDGEEFNVSLSRMDEDSVWEVTSGDYYYLDGLYEEASDNAQSMALSRSNKSEADFTPICDMPSLFSSTLSKGFSLPR